MATAINPILVSMFVDGVIVLDIERIGLIANFQGIDSDLELKDSTGRVERKR